MAGNPVNVIVYGNPTSSTSGIVNGTVNGVINYFNLNYYKQNATPIISVTQTTVNTQQTKYIDFLVPGLIGFAILVSPMFSLVNISSEYKKTKIFKQLSLTPLTKMEWLTSKVMWYIVLGAFSFLLMVGVGIFLLWRQHNVNRLAYTLPNSGSNAVRCVRHAGWNSNKEP